MNGNEAPYTFIYRWCIKLTGVSFE